MSIERRISLAGSTTHVARTTHLKWPVTHCVSHERLTLLASSTPHAAAPGLEPSRPTSPRLTPPSPW